MMRKAPRLHQVEPRGDSNAEADGGCGVEKCKGKADVGVRSREACVVALVS